MPVRVSLVVALALASGCGREIVLGDSERVLCVGLGCGGAGQSGSAGQGGSFAGSSVGGVGGNGGSPSSDAGAPDSEGGAGAVPGCEPADTDESCDGLNQACELAAEDAACSATCEGTFVDGTSYMSCLAAASFDDAEAACRQNGMHLVKIDDEQENATVLGLALDDYVWIGGSNRDEERVHAWLDGTTFYAAGAPVSGVYQNFGVSDPASNAELRCVQLREQSAGTWSMWRCSGAQSFVCERYEF